MRCTSSPASGTFGLVAVGDDFFVALRMIGGQVSVFLSEDLDQVLSAGDLSIFADLGIDEMDLGMLAGDLDLFPDEALAIIARKLGLGHGRKSGHVLGGRNAITSSSTYRPQRANPGGEADPAARKMIVVRKAEAGAMSRPPTRPRGLAPSPGGRGLVTSRARRPWRTVSFATCGVTAAAG